MRQYQDMLRHIINNGKIRQDRTGTGTISVFGYQNRYNLQDGFPLVTTKKIHFKSVVHELLWMLSGNCNIRYLQENGVTIWDEWADENGYLGPVYGKQWRSWYDPSITLENTKLDGCYIDQIKNVINEIKTNPYSRRLVVSAWNVADLPYMKLQPCHVLFQFYVHDNKLSCHLYQRSADAFLGVPFNIASYALLTSMIAHVCNLEVGEFIHSFGDLHIYNNHRDQVNMQLTRIPMQLPKLSLNPCMRDIDEFMYDDILLKDYNPFPAIKGEVSV